MSIGFSHQRFLPHCTPSAKQAAILLPLFAKASGLTVTCCETMGVNDDCVYYYAKYAASNPNPNQSLSRLAKKIRLIVHNKFAMNAKCPRLVPLPTLSNGGSQSLAFSQSSSHFSHPDLFSPIDTIHKGKGVSSVLSYGFIRCLKQNPWASISNVISYIIYTPPTAKSGCRCILRRPFSLLFSSGGPPPVFKRSLIPTPPPAKLSSSFVLTELAS